MVTFDFYREIYGGDSVPENEFTAFARDASAQMERYKRIYTVTPTGENSEQMALCAMIDALYYFAWAQSGGAAASVSVGSVSSSRSQGAQPDLSPKAQSLELYRCACLYLDIYRGPKGGEQDAEGA